MKFTPAKPYLLAETLETLSARLEAAGEKKFRAKQILDWVYKKFETDVDKMTNLPASLREWLKETFAVRALPDGGSTLLPTERVLVKGDPDATQKLLLKLEDGSLIETVLIKAPDFNDPEENLRKTVCISTQVGCAYGCKFCASGLAGWKRDLSAGEIVSQLFEIIKFQREMESVAPLQTHPLPPPTQTREGNDSGAKAPAPQAYTLEGKQATDDLRPADMSSTATWFDNIVVMGMGEPLANFENLMRALGNLNAEWGFKFGARRITVSTSGVVPKILELADLPVQFRLAISLHGATNDVRSQIMPVNKKYPLEVLIPAARAYNLKHNRMLTFEYILINELNDTYEQADALIKICEGMKVHINCIPYNTVDGLKWKRPSIMRQQEFVKKLKDAGVSVTIRHEKGNRIEAACGQLRLKMEGKVK